ncbi:unnamed protein product, partial [Ectocarpus sp. 8 AP-2014]
GGSGEIGRVGGGSGGVAASLWSGVPRPGAGSQASSGRRLFSGRTGSVSAARVEELWEEDKAMERGSNDGGGGRRG